MGMDYDTEFTAVLVYFNWVNQHDSLSLLQPGRLSSMNLMETWHHLMQHAVSYVSWCRVSKINGKLRFRDEVNDIGNKKDM